MPIYEYECPECGIFEVVQKASEKPLKANPECCSKSCPRKAVRLISSSAFHLKGSGWYKSDYASSTKPSKKGGGESTESKSAPVDASANSANTGTSSTEKVKTSESGTKPTS